MWSFPTLEPAIVSGGSFVIERLLDRPGDVDVRIGDTVDPHTVIARMGSTEKSITLFVASELGISNDKIARYLTKTVGSTFGAGDVVARTRKGLRTVTVTAPVAGTLTAVDAQGGTVELRASSASSELHALVHGEVERIIPDYGAVIRTDSARVFGLVGFGGEAIGRLVAGIDRPERELTADQVKDTWKGCIVLTGMTIGVPALTKLRQVGVAGIIVGSLSEAEIRRFLATAQGAPETDVATFWRAGHPGAAFQPGGATAPFTIIVTEGFGRVPMADPVFSFLKQHEGTTISMLAATAVGEQLSRPEIYVPPSASNANDETRSNDDLIPGRAVRIVEASRLGLVGTVVDGPADAVWEDGARTTVVTLDIEGGARELTPVANVEVLV